MWLLSANVMQIYLDNEIRNQLGGETYNFFKRLATDKIKETHQFSMIIGLDNANTFDKWVNYQELERMASFVVVPRKGVKRIESVDWYLKQPHIYIHGENNIIEVSSTMVREQLKIDDSVIKLYEWLNPDVFNYILDNNLYNI